MSDGMVFDIQRFSLHDGPGIRTIVFLKGCPLRCLWCSNPESQHISQELMYMSSRCIQCGSCFSACSHFAIVEGTYAPGRIIQESCVLCGDCITACPTGALSMKGTLMSADDVVSEVMKDRQFYASSGGGVTISGGEPFFQHEFLFKLAKRLHDRGVHIVVETAGDAAWECIEKSLPYIDMFLFDVKIVDRMEHKKLTGGYNDRIIGNLSKLMDRKVSLLVRIPIIPGLNDADHHIRDFVRLFTKLSINTVELLAYHDFGASKYEYLNRTYRIQDSPSDEVHNRILELVECFKRSGITAVYDKG